MEEVSKATQPGPVEQPGPVDQKLQNRELNRPLDRTAKSHMDTDNPDQMQRTENGMFFGWCVPVTGEAGLHQKKKG